MSVYWAAGRAAMEQIGDDGDEPHRVIPNEADLASEPPPDAEEQQLFVRHTAADLLAMPRSFRWLIRGLLADPTYGTLGGGAKVLKTYVAMSVMLAQASGVSLFGRFPVDRAAPVLAYVGEGGRVPWTNRLERVADAMGVDLAALPLHVSFGIAPIDSGLFVASLTRDLADLTPDLFVLDPMYAYHGAKVNPSNLHEAGALLTSLSSRVLDADASLLVVNHFNQTGSGHGLQRITQAGGAEWSDSWILLSHREKPDVAAGDFRLLVEVGSRQWGGNSWALDMHLGRFDPEAGQHLGAITWEFAPWGDDDGHDIDTRAAAILQAASDGDYTMTEILRSVGGHKGSSRHTFDELVTAGELHQVEVQRTEGAKIRTRAVWHPTRPRPPMRTTGPDDLDAPTPTTLLTETTPGPDHRHGPSGAVGGLTDPDHHAPIGTGTDQKSEPDDPDPDPDHDDEPLEDTDEQLAAKAAEINRDLDERSAEVYQWPDRR